MKLANRVKQIAPSPTLEITAKAKALKAKGMDVVGFGAGEPDFDTPEHIKDAAISAIEEGFTKYTDVAGIAELKDAIVQKLKNENGLTYSRDEILISNGGKHSLYNIAQALFEAGDEVLVPSPYWVSYPPQILLADATPVILKTSDKTGFKVTPAEIDKAVTPKTKAFILNSPSNPTGAAYTEDELSAIAKALKEKKIICISDEIYEKIVYDQFKHVSIAKFIKDQTLLVNGASKVFSMTGWRMGFTAGPKDVVSAMSNIQGQSTSNVCSITQKACTTAYRSSQDYLHVWLKEFKARRDLIVDGLNAIKGVSCTRPQGAFYVFPNISSLFGHKTPRGTPIKTSSDFATYLLEDHQVAVVPGEGFGADGYMRLSYATSMDNIKKGMDRILSAVSQLQ